MTAALHDAPRGVAARISTITQLMGALARIQSAAIPLALLSLVSGAFNVGAPLVAKALGLMVIRPSLEQGYVAYLLIVIAIGSLLSALGQRLLVRGADGWLTLDRPLAGGVLVIALTSLTFVAISGVYTQVALGTLEPQQAIVPILAIGAVYLVVLWIAAKLSLWFIGVLMGRKDVTPAASWRLMRGATRGLVLGYLAFGVPLVVVSIVMIQSGVGAADLGNLSFANVVMTYGGVIYAFACSGLTATIYDLRVTQRSNVADVFD